MVGFVVVAGRSPEPLVTAPPGSLVNPVLVSVVGGGLVPPAFLASAAAFSSDMCMEVCLVAVTVLVVVSSAVMVTACDSDTGVVTDVVVPGCGTASLPAGVDVVAGSIGIGVMLISQSSHSLTTLPDSLQ